MEENFTLNQITPIEEKKNIECKGVKDIRNRDVFSEIVDYAKENINSFVNGDGGILYIGIENNGLVTGVNLDRDARDEIRRRISQTVKNFYPPLETSACKIDLVPIYSDKHEIITDQFIVKIEVTQGQESVYWMSSNKTVAFIRLTNEKQMMHPRMIERRIKNGRIAPLTTNTTLESIKKQENNKTDFSNAEGMFKREIASKRTPLVQFKSKLPVAYCNLDETSEGEFIFRRFEGLRVEVSRQTILRDFMHGLSTPLAWLTRPYLQLLETNLFEATLGGTSLILSAEETIDLCECIDEVCEKYKQIIIDAENHLQTWNFHPVHQERNFYGFEILSVKPRIWDLMYKFSHEFHDSQGSSNWHIFDTQYESIKISRNFFDHALLIPRRNQYFGDSSGTEYLDIIYVADDIFLQGGYIRKRNWKEHIGEHGTWSAETTKEWIINSFI